MPAPSSLSISLPVGTGSPAPSDRIAFSATPERIAPLPKRAIAPPPEEMKKPRIIEYLKDAEADTIQDRQQRAVAQLLSRFKYLVDIAATPAEDGATKEIAAANAFRMEVESSALVRAAEDLLQLSRELKEMWLFGPSRGIGEGEGEGKMDEDSKKVGEMVDALLKRHSGVSES